MVHADKSDIACRQDKIKEEIDKRVTIQVKGADPGKRRRLVTFEFIQFVLFPGAFL
jgi:hypothetical protein